MSVWPAHGVGVAFTCDSFTWSCSGMSQERHALLRSGLQHSGDAPHRLGTVTLMKRPCFFPHHVDLQHSLLGVNNKLVSANTSMGPNWNEFTMTRSS